MNFNLLSQNLLLIVCGITAVAVLSLLKHVLWPLVLPEPPKTKPKRKKKTETTPEKSEKLTPHHVLRTKPLVVLVAVCLTGAVTLWRLLGYYTNSPLPASLILMMLPAFVAAGALALVLYNRRRLWPVASFCLLCGLLFSLLLINNYYRFYPNLGTVFNRTGAAPLNNSQKEVLVQFASQTAEESRQQSVETSLTSITTAPTKGKVYSLNIPGATSGFHARTAYVYVPAIYSNPSQINLPVIVLTPGFPGLTSNWINSGLQTTMDDFARQHDGITPLVFMVDDTGSLTNDTECVNSPRGNVETYLTVDVPTYIKSHFNVESSPSHWSIGGLSLGGTCSIMLALRHPTVYHYFIDLGGELGPEIGSEQKTIDELFGGSESSWRQHQPVYILAHTSYTGKGLGGFFGVGKQDSPGAIEAATELSNESQKAGIETVYESINGQHTFNVWQQTFKLALPWVSNRLGATDCSGSCL